MRSAVECLKHAELMAEVLEGETGYRASRTSIYELAEALFRLHAAEWDLIDNWYLTSPRKNERRGPEDDGRPGQLPG